MKGSVDEFGRALLDLSILPNENSEPTRIRGWVDTAFTGELVVPRRVIKAMNLNQTAGIGAQLADGSKMILESFTCLLDWFGELRVTEVIANDSEYPLIGVGLLLGRRLLVDYQELTVELM